MIINQYKESEFYEKYKDTYFSDVIFRDVFKCELKLHKLYGLNKKTYEDIHQLNIDVMEDLIKLREYKIFCVNEKLHVKRKTFSW